VAHQIHNLDLVLRSALHVLDGGGAGEATPAARTQALRLGLTALGRASGLLAAFAGLSDHEGGDGPVDAGELLGWIEDLAAPRARQTETRLTVDRQRAEGVVIDRRPSARAANSLLAGAIARLGRGRHLALVAAPEPRGVRLELALEGCPPEESARLEEELAGRLRILGEAGGTSPAGGWVLLPGRRGAPGAAGRHTAGQYAAGQDPLGEGGAGDGEGSA